MKRVIALFLLAPALACAQLHIISGSQFTITSESSGFGFNFNGNGFSGRVDFGFVIGAGNPLQFPIPPDGFIFGEDSAPGPEGDVFAISLSVNGVPWAYTDGSTNPDNGSASAQVSACCFPNYPGTFSRPFSFEAAYLGAPASEFFPSLCFGSSPSPCQELAITGSGTGIFTVVRSDAFPGEVQISNATFSFGAPEPATGSLLLLGFAGLAVCACRRSFTRHCARPHEARSSKRRH